jgi:hypothetical protein
VTTYKMTGTLKGTLTGTIDGTFEGEMVPIDDPNPPDPNPPNGNFVLGDRPFSDQSSWNKKVPSNAKYGNLSWPPATPYNYLAGWGGYTPSVEVSVSTDPVVQVQCPDSWGWPAETRSIRIKKGVSGAPGTDGELVVIDDQGVCHNFWQFVRTSDTSATCTAYAADNVTTGTGWGTKSPFKGAGITAVGASMLAGLLVEEETKKGVVEHALQLCVDEVLIRPGATGEAINSDGWSNDGIVQEADWLAIPRSAQKPSGLSPLGEVVWIALREYGSYVVDKTSMCSKIRMQLNAYSQQIADDLTRDLGKMYPMLKKVG